MDENWGVGNGIGFHYLDVLRAGERFSNADEQIASLLVEQRRCLERGWQGKVDGGMGECMQG